MDHRYLLYGLGIHSEIPLWARLVEECPRDVTIRWGDGIEPWDDAHERVVKSSSGDFQLSWSRITRIQIRDGREIVAELGPEGEEDHLRHVVSGLGLGLLLHQRGLFTLHASAVAIAGGAALFVGAKGIGKSTIAGTMKARGHSVLTDDVAAITVSEGSTPYMYPGVSSLNLWPDAAAHFGEATESWPQVWPRSIKRVKKLEESIQMEPLQVRGLFVLKRNPGERDRVSFGERLTPLQALVELIGHSHTLRMVEDRESLPRYTRQCASLVESVPVFRVTRPASLDLLPALAREIEDRMSLLDDVIELTQAGGR